MTYKMLLGATPDDQYQTNYPKPLILKWLDRSTQPVKMGSKKTGTYNPFSPLYHGQWFISDCKHNTIIAIKLTNTRSSTRCADKLNLI